jgi:predicted GNAT family acetyltransferase
MPVTDNEATHRYEITVDGQTAHLRYARRHLSMNQLDRARPPELRGRGLADQLVKTALEAAREAGVRVIPTCPFVQAYLKKHPEYQGLVDGV